MLESEGEVMVCVELEVSDVQVPTQVEFSVSTFTSSGTALGKHAFYGILSSR